MCSAEARRPRLKLPDVVPDVIRDTTLAEGIPAIKLLAKAQLEL